MADDYPVFINGRLMSAKRWRKQQRIERELSALERDLMIIDATIQWREARNWATPEEVHRVFCAIERKSAHVPNLQRQTVNLKYRTQHNARRR
jgi:hypothetical protein